MTTLVIDLGTTFTKATVWSERGAGASGRAMVASIHQGSDRVEQEPERWWPAVVDACAQARAAAPHDFDAIVAVGFAAARQTFVPVTADGTALGHAIVWSDRRAGDGRRGSLTAKARWLATHEPERMERARWLLAPRDLLVWQLTGVVTTDHTLASAADWYDSEFAPLLPAPQPPTTIVGPIRPERAAALGVPDDAVVVIGAGDRACEVVGVGAGPADAMVSWGTTANVSVPLALSAPISGRPPSLGAVVATRAAIADGWLLEGGVSAAGSLLAWLGELTGRPADELATRAGQVAAGAEGVIAVPWLGGARAPWWQAGAAAGFAGLAPHHSASHLACAAIEGVARDIVGCLHEIERATGVSRQRLALAGGGAVTPAWVRALTGLTERPADLRRSGQAASAGAAVLVAAALGDGWTIDDIDPVAHTYQPDGDVVRRYRSIAPEVAAATQAFLSLPSEPT